MIFSEKKLRVYGYLAMVLVVLLFFIPEMAVSRDNPYTFARGLVLSILLPLIIWEPTRFFILQLREHFGGLQHVRERVFYTLLILVPFAFIIGLLRIWIEGPDPDTVQKPGEIIAASYTIGQTLLLVLLQATVYESIYFFNEWNKSRNEAEELRRLNFQIQFDSLKVQIQPHFLFNTLNTLIGLIEVDAKRAIRFTEEMSYVYRYLLEGNDRLQISLEEEMKFARAYFFLIKTRYTEGLFLEMPGEEQFNQYQLPPLTLQVLIENAVKHNIITRQKPLTIKVSVNSDESTLTVSNNIQYKTEALNSGKGLIHMQKKFSLLNLPEIKVLRGSQSFTVIVPISKVREYEGAYN